MIKWRTSFMPAGASRQKEICAAPLVPGLLHCYNKDKNKILSL